jgi:predicted secreted acid phosphatase
MQSITRRAVVVGINYEKDADLKNDLGVAESWKFYEFLQSHCGLEEDDIYYLSDQEDQHVENKPTKANFERGKLNLFSLSALLFLILNDI